MKFQRENNNVIATVMFSKGWKSAVSTVNCEFSQWICVFWYALCPLIESFCTEMLEDRSM